MANIGGTLAVTKGLVGLVGQVEGLVWKFPSTLCGKNAHSQSEAL